MGLLTVKNTSSTPNRRHHLSSSSTRIEQHITTTTYRMNQSTNENVQENRKNKTNTQRKPKNSLINKLFKRKKTTKPAATVTSSSSTDSDSEEQNKHYRFFSKRKSKSSGVKNVTEKFDHVVINPSSPYQIRNRKIQNGIDNERAKLVEDHLYMNTSDIQRCVVPNYNSNRSIVSEKECVKTMKNGSLNSEKINFNEGLSRNSNEIFNDRRPYVHTNGNLRHDQQSLNQVRNDSTKKNHEFIQRNGHEFSQHRNQILQPISSNRIYYKSDDNLPRNIYENTVHFDQYSGNQSSPSLNRSRIHTSEDNVTLQKRNNSKNESNSSNENINSNSLSRRSRAARNERYYKRLSRDHETEKTFLPLNPKNKQKIFSTQHANSLPMSTPSNKMNYTPRYPNFQKMNQSFYNLNGTYSNSSTYPLPQTMNSRVSYSNHPQNSRTTLNHSRLSTSSSSSYPNHSTYPPQVNVSRMSSSSSLSQQTNPNHTPTSTADMKLVHAIPYKSISYESNINNEPVHKDIKSISYDNINLKQNPLKKIPPSPPPRNPNRKTIAIYEAPNSIAQTNQKRYSHQPSEQIQDVNDKLNMTYPFLYQSDENFSKLAYNEAYTGERAYLIKQAHPNGLIKTNQNFSEFIPHEKSNNIKQTDMNEVLNSTEPIDKSNQSRSQTYFHHKDTSQLGTDCYYPDNRYTNNERLNESFPQPKTKQKVQYYSATSKILAPSQQTTTAHLYQPLPTHSQIQTNQLNYENQEQLYENTQNINSSLQTKRPSSISPPSDSRIYKRSFKDQNFPNPQILLKNQRLTKSNETLPYSENINRMNEIGIPVHPGFCKSQHTKVTPMKRSIKTRPLLEIKESIRPLSIVLEKSENELDSDKLNSITVSSISKKSSSNNSQENASRKPSFNEKGLKITRENKNLVGSTTNLDDALTELEQIYESLNLNDEDLLDRAERRDLPICYQLSKDQVRDNSEIDEIDRILSTYSRSQGNSMPRRIGISNKINDDMAIRKYRYQNENQSNPNCSDIGSYLLTSPTLSPPPFYENKPASPVPFIEPDITRDDVVYRNTKYVNNLLKPHDPQPFGIPLRPAINTSSTDYLHVTPDTEKYRSTFHNSKTPDIVTDDLAYRNLRKDYNKDCNSLTSYNLIPAFRNEREKYLLNDTERFQKRKKRAMRSLSGNLFMKDYHNNEPEASNDINRVRHQINSIRSETNSPEYFINKSQISENDFEKLKNRWLSSPSPDDLQRQKDRDATLINYINNNSLANKKVDNIIKNKTETLLKEPNEEINISSEVENLRKKFVADISNEGSVRKDKSNPFKKMLKEDETLDLTTEIANIRKKFVSKNGKDENKDNRKSSKDIRNTLVECEHKNKSKNTKNQFKNNENKNDNTKDGENKKSKEEKTKKNSKKECEENPYVSQFENIRNMFTGKTELDEAPKEIIKPKKKIKKFRETNNNCITSKNDYLEYKSNMDKTIHNLKNKVQSGSFTNQGENISKCKMKFSSSSPNESSQSDNTNSTHSNTSFDDKNISPKHFNDETDINQKENITIKNETKELPETNEQLNKKAKQTSSTVTYHKPIKLNQFPINLEEDFLQAQMNENKGEFNHVRKSILKNVQTESMESEYDNIPNNKNQIENNYEEIPNFDDLVIPSGANVYEKLEFVNVSKNNKIRNIIENLETKEKSNKTIIDEQTEKKFNINAPILNGNIERYGKQTSISSEYDNVSLKNENHGNKFETKENPIGLQNKEILIKTISKVQTKKEEDEEPFVSLTMKNIPSEDIESTTTSDNEFLISEISDDNISVPPEVIENYFQNSKIKNLPNTNIRISDLKNLNLIESDSSFNSEIHNILNNKNSNQLEFKENDTDSDIENLPIDLQLEILENVTISSLESDSQRSQFIISNLRNDQTKDQYSLDLENTLDNVQINETHFKERNYNNGSSSDLKKRNIKTNQTSIEIECTENNKQNETKNSNDIENSNDKIKKTSSNSPTSSRLKKNINENLESSDNNDYKINENIGSTFSNQNTDLNSEYIHKKELNDIIESIGESNEHLMETATRVKQNGNIPKETIDSNANTEASRITQPNGNVSRSANTEIIENLVETKIRENGNISREIIGINDITKEKTEIVQPNGIIPERSNNEEIQTIVKQNGNVSNGTIKTIEESIENKISANNAHAKESVPIPPTLPMSSNIDKLESTSSSLQTNSKTPCTDISPYRRRHSQHHSEEDNSKSISLSNICTNLTARPEDFIL